MAPIASQHNILDTHFSALEHLVPGFARSTDSLVLELDFTSQCSHRLNSGRTSYKHYKLFHLDFTSQCNHRLNSGTHFLQTLFTFIHPRLHSPLDLPAPTTRPGSNCSQLLYQLMYLISLSATRGAPLSFNFNKLFFFGSTGPRPDEQQDDLLTSARRL